jgi:hypothetical protein
MNGDYFRLNDEQFERPGPDLCFLRQGCAQSACQNHYLHPEKPILSNIGAVVRRLRSYFSEQNSYAGRDSLFQFLNEKSGLIRPVCRLRHQGLEADWKYRFEEPRYPLAG